MPQFTLSNNKADGTIYLDGNPIAVANDRAAAAQLLDMIESSITLIRARSEIARQPNSRYAMDAYHAAWQQMITAYAPVVKVQ